MDADEFREAVESRKATELNRLGSNKLLVAVTDAELDAETVIRAAANSEFAATNTFEAWADDEEDDDAREVFAAIADQEREHYERVVDSLADLNADVAESFEPADGGPMHTYLRSRDDTLGRIGGGLVGRGLVSLRTHTQIIGFFVNEPDERCADLFRDLKRETEAEVERGLELLEARCGGDEDWERARAAAEYTIQLAYDDYEDALAGLGIDPKPIC
jgi:hypothetical protein